MATRTIAATYNDKKSGDSKKGEAQFDVSESIANAVERYTEVVVLSIFSQQVIVKLQGFIRSLIKQGKSPEVIQTAVDGWRPSTASGRARKTPLDKAVEAVEDMNEEDYEVLLTKLKERKRQLRGG